MGRHGRPLPGHGKAAIDRIAAHVLATERHDAALGDSSLVVDLDLTILASPPEEFAAFERCIRREYAHVPEPAFRLARREILQRFVARPAIYRVPALHEQLERRARANLERRIAEL